MTEKFNTRSDITKEICGKNFARLRQKYKDVLPTEEVSLRADLLAVTHTFADSRLSRVFPPKAMDFAGLYARRWLKPVKADFEGEGAAHQVGLYEYVFAFHGIHDAHFARDHDFSLVQFPVGVFVSRHFERAQSDRVKVVNATYRDLAVASEIEPPYRNWFLCSEDARVLVAVETAADHRGDFWRYWGNPDTAEFNHKNHWKQLFEFHFYRHVPVGELLAIIWPERRIVRLDEKEDVFEPVNQQVLTEIRDSFPEISIHFYQQPCADGKNPVKKAFARASFKLACDMVASDTNSL